MAQLDKVPVIEVNKDNLSQLWPAIILAIKTSTFIAVDTELSGLGNRKLLNAKIIDERYHHMCEVARTRSIVAFGLSCYKLITSDQKDNGDGVKQGRARTLRFQVQTFNMLLLCNEQYVVEPTSLRFLVEHGFDFNLQYSVGLPYTRGNDKEDEANQTVRAIFTEILLSEVPLVLHNALVDLVFLYQNLFAALPTSQQAFITDQALMYPSGIYDTKYITDFKARMGASYLEYVFKKCQRGNIVSSDRGWSHMEISFLSYTPSECISYMPCQLTIGKHSHTSEDLICPQYANHGWCPEGSTCTKCHDIDVILDVQEKSIARPSKSSSQNGTPNQSQPDSQETATEGPHVDDIQTHEQNNVSESTFGEPTASVNKAGSHRAGFDAFMTGYIFAFYSARYGERDVQSQTGTDGVKGSELGMSEYKNKLYLVGKDIPLQVTQSSFSKPSKGYRMKMANIKPSLE